METKFLALVRGEGKLLTFDQLKAYARNHRENGLVIAYHQVLVGEQIRPITKEEMCHLPLQDRIYLLQLRTSMDHEEQEKDEIFLGNFSRKDKGIAFCQTKWRPRYGKNSFSQSGRLMPELSPAFAKVQDVWPMVKWP